VSFSLSPAFKKSFFLICSLFLLNSRLAFSASNGHCVDPNDLSFFQQFTKYSSSREEKINALESTCDELAREELHTPMSTYDITLEKIMSGPVSLFLGTGIAAFSALQNTTEGQKYMTELSKIKVIKNPIERVRLTYQLAAKNSGHYDTISHGTKTWSSGYFLGGWTPENLLENYKRRGSVGVCREFARLLAWSLLQVARHKDSKCMGLCDTDFSYDIKGGQLTNNEGVTGSHAWIRINLPVFENGKLKDWHHFDLDTTWYPQTYTPLFPRRLGTSKKTRLKALRQCEQIRTCLVKISEQSSLRSQELHPRLRPALQ
jgi:hypothetical protein